jgi:hypothetical protein
MEGNSPRLIKVIFQCFPERLRKTTKLAVRIGGVPAEIRTKHHTNTTVETPVDQHVWWPTVMVKSGIPPLPELRETFLVVC